MDPVVSRSCFSVFRILGQVVGLLSRGKIHDQIPKTCVPWSQLDVWHRPKVGRAAEQLQLVLCFRSLLAKTFNADMNVKYGCGLKSEVNLVWSIRRKKVWNNEQTYKCCSYRTQSHWRVNWFSATCKAALLSQFESHQNGNDSATWRCHRAITDFTDFTDFGPVWLEKHHFLQGFLNHFVLAKDAVLDSWDTLILQKVHAASWCSRHRHTVVSAMSTQSGWPQWVSRGCEFCGTLPFQHCLQHSLQHGFPVKFNINWYIPVVFLHRKHQKDFAYLSKLRVSFEAATSCASFPPALLGFKQSNS